MEAQDSSRRVWFSDVALLCYLAAFKLLLHFSFNSYYGYHGDELYFIACGEHLDWGYVDIGPLVPWTVRLSRELLGESLFALRFFPAIAGALTVLLTGLLARRLGAGRFGQLVAALSIIIAPVWLLSQNIICLPGFEPLFWVVCAYLIVSIIQTGNSKLWLWVGVVSGVGLLNKPSMLFFGFGLVVGLLLTPHRKYLLNKWLWLGGVIALVIASPFVIWQVRHDWPTLEFVRSLNEDTMSRITAFEFVVGQIVYVHPLNAPVWLAGLVFFFAAREGKPYRLFAWIYVAIFLVLLFVKSKIYYLAPAYPMLFAGGGLAIERFFRQRAWRWPQVAAPAAMVLGGLVTAPVGLPILPIEKLDGYVRVATGGLIKNAYELTGTFHDMFGWEDEVATVARVYNSLTPEERADCIIIGNSFMDAGAIDLFGKEYGLPKATSTHQNNYFWGPPAQTGQVAIAVGGRREQLQEFFEELVVAATFVCEERRDKTPVYICRKPRQSFEEVWPSLRQFAFRN